MPLRGNVIEIQIVIYVNSWEAELQPAFMCGDSSATEPIGSDLNHPFMDYISAIYPERSMLGAAIQL